MAYAGIQMFMEKLNHLINCNHNPLFNNPEIISKRPKFQLLYEQLGSMIQTLFIDQHQDLHDLHDLKNRFLSRAEVAQYMVDLFLSGVHIRNNGDFTISEDFNRSLNLDDVRRSFESIHVEFMSMLNNNMKMDISQRTGMLNKSVAAPVSIFISSPGSKKLLVEIFVGFDRDAELIRDKLVEDHKKLDVVSIVGMGGIGKTTLATKVFKDSYVKHYFHVRVWVTVSQTYDKRDVLIQILESIGVDSDSHSPHSDLEKASDSHLRELVHKHLFDNTGSRILLTTRLIEVAKHAKSDGLVHHLGNLNKEKSWELLCKKVFNDNECPKWAIEPGMQIVENCHGLPLAVVVIAGVLAKQAWSKKFWLEIAYRTGSYIVDDQNGCLETLALSYNHLPLHMRECFLYLGGFPENHKFQVQRLISLWVAEGFIQQDGNGRLEDIAEGYLMDLINRNLVIVSDRRKSNGAVKACMLHGLVRELCLRKAKEVKFILQTERLILSSKFSIVTAPPYKPVRMFINKEINIVGFPYLSAQNLRAILLFSYFRSMSDDIEKYFCSFVLLRVLDLQNYRLNDFPKGMELLVHLRYLAIWNPSAGVPSAICNLWSLQTLVYISSYARMILPSNISDLVNLRHLWSYHPSTTIPDSKRSFFLLSIEKPMNLQTISNVELGDGVDNFQKCFPCIKELTCSTYLDGENDFKSLTYLEKLKLTCARRRKKSVVLDSPKGGLKNTITFPPTLKTLELVRSRLPWSEMSIIQSLPNLQVLKLRYTAFEGSCWNTNGQVFQRLEFLKLEWLDIKLWEAYSTSFPCLKQLEIFHCYNLEEVSLEIGYIPMLELIKLYYCSNSVGESVRRIQEEQHDLGNYDLKIDFRR